MRVRSRIFILFTLFFTIYFILFIPVRSYALTYNEFMRLTERGVSTVVHSMSRVASALSLSRSLLGLGALGGSFGLAILLWDASNRLRDAAKVSVSSSSNLNLSPFPSSSSFSWGMTSPNSEYVYCVFYSLNHDPENPCSPQIVPFSCTPPSSMPRSAKIVGGETILTYYDTTSCPNFRFPQNVIQKVYYVEVPESHVSYESQSSGSPASQSDLSNTQTAISLLTQAIEKLQSELSAVNSNILSIAASSNVSIPSMSASSTLELLTEALSTLQNGVAVQKDVDYSVTDESKAIPVPDSSSGSSSGSSDPASEPSAPPVGDGVCTDYVRRKTFRQVWDKISSLSQSSGIVILLNKLVLNPTSGSAPDKISFSVSNFGSVNFDLNTYHYRDIVVAFRFFVLAGALVAAYYIMFS